MEKNKWKFYTANLMKIIIGLEEQIAQQHKIIFNLKKTGILEDEASQNNKNENKH